MELRRPLRLLGLFAVPNGLRRRLDDWPLLPAEILT